MKKVILAAAVLFVGLTACSEKEPQLNEKNIKKVVKAMTLEEKARLVNGTGMAGFDGSTAVVGATNDLVPGAAGTTAAIERLGIPAIVLADGPAGLRISPTREGTDATFYCTGFPVGTLMACTWNTELVEQVGKAMGEEVLEYGSDVLLAPALNIHRNPLCGRNFEYYSEDPYLTGKITAAMVNGVQSNGVGTSIKHFAVNNQETNRQMNDAIVTPRALREIYLKGFEIAVKDAQPWTIMSSYNHLNGVYTSESRELLTDIARDEWGFEGLIMTDWFGGNSSPAQIHAGNDLIMPGTDRQYFDIIEAVENGTLSMEDLDTCVERVLELIVKTPRFKGFAYDNQPDLTAHAQVTRNSAAEGMVLLENNGALPFAKNIKNVALFGTTSYDFIAGGTGSGDVNKAYVIDLEQGLENAGYAVNAEVKDMYNKHAADEAARLAAEAAAKASDQLSAFMTKERAGEFVPNSRQLAQAVKSSDVALITIGRNSGEFADRKVEGDFALTAEEKSLIDNVAAAFHAAGKQVVVVLNVGGVIETASWKNTPDAVLLAWQAGQEGGNTVADVLAGKVNPSGKLSMTFPVNYMDHASSANFPFDEEMIDFSFGANSVGDAKHDRKNVDYTNYEEDVYVGYRYFDTFGKDVSYPFGYGLSYTTFEYSNPTLVADKGAYTVTVDVTNTGKVAGKEVVEVYMNAPAIEEGRPMQELVAFAKTKELAAGETQTLTFNFTDYELAWYDVARSAWVTEAGNYNILLAASSRDVKAQVALTVAKEKIVEQTHDVLHPTRELNVLKK